MRKESSGLKLILGYLGVFLIFVGILTLVPLICLFWYPNESFAYIDFIIPSGINIVLGIILYFVFLFKRKKGKIKKFQDSLLLVLIWIFAILTGALPFVFAAHFHNMPMTFSEGFFEASSAYTTTGLTAFKDYVDVSNAVAPHVFCLHRSWMQFVGGVGLVLLLASVIGNQANLPLYFAEGHSDKLLPSLGRSAKLISGIYILYNIIGSLALWLCGMDWFDAINTSMCALSGGGMSPRSTNIFYYSAFEGRKELNGVLPVNSYAIHCVIILLVMLAAISFVLHTFLLRGNFKDFFKDTETKYAIGAFVIVYIVCVSCSLFSHRIQSINDFFSPNGTAIWFNSLFYYANASTNAGFMNTDITGILNQGRPVIFILTLVMLVGGGVGSTAGGIKKYRMALCLKYLTISIHHKFSPNNQMYPATVYRYGEVKEITNDDVRDAFNYLLLFISTYIVGLVILAFLPNISLESSMFTLSSALSNTGLGFFQSNDGSIVYDITGYTTAYQAEGNIMLWTLSISMILGRLEIMPFLFAGRSIPAGIKSHRIAIRKREEEKKAALANNAEIA